MADIKYYDVILKPVVTEKSMNAMADKKYTFLVHTDATKSQIKEAVEKMFAGHKGKIRKHHEPRRKEQETRNGYRQDCQDQESNRCSDRGQQGYRDFRGTVKNSPDLYLLRSRTIISHDAS